MARKVDRKADKAAGKAAEELDILHPERTVVLAGRKVTVREYGFVEGVRLRLVAKPFTEGLFALLKDERAGEYEAVLDVIAEHLDVVMELVAVAADVKTDWIAQLSSEDGDLLFMMWWGVNYPFFMRAALQRLRVELQVKALSAGAASTPPLSPTDTASGTLEGTPSEN